MIGWNLGFKKDYSGFIENNGELQDRRLILAFTVSQVQDVCHCRNMENFLFEILGEPESKQCAKLSPGGQRGDSKCITKLRFQEYKAHRDKQGQRAQRSWLWPEQLFLLLLRRLSSVQKDEGSKSWKVLSLRKSVLLGHFEILSTTNLYGRLLWVPNKL